MQAHILQSGECLKYKTQRFKGLEKTKDKLKSKRDRHQKGSNHWIKANRSVKKKQAKITNKRTDYLHKASKHIIDYCVHNEIDNIIIGDIQTKKLVSKRRGLNKSTQNEGLLSRFKRLHSI